MVGDILAMYSEPRYKALKYVRQLMEDRGYTKRYLLKDIAKELGYEVVKRYSFSLNCCGYVCEEGKAIFINRSHSIQRQELALAHEIGEIVLNRVYDGQKPEYVAKMKETHCDLFAHDLICDLQEDNRGNVSKSQEIIKYNPEIGAQQFFQLPMLFGALVADGVGALLKWRKLDKRWNEDPLLRVFTFIGGIILFFGLFALFTRGSKNA